MVKTTYWYCSCIPTQRTDYLLDEPTSNLDSLNEAMILKSLLNVKAEKLIILVSHRQSTMAICDQVIGIENGRMS